MDKPSQSDYIETLEIPESELRNNYDHLLNLYKSAVKYLEEKNQELYKYKRECSTYALMEKEYQQELDAQGEQSLKIKQLEKHVQSLNEEKSMLQKAHEEKLDHYVAELNEKNNIIAELNLKYDDLLKTKSTNSIDEQDKLESENIKLKNEITALEERIIELKQDLEVSQEEKLSVDKNILILTEELNEIKENLKLKREESEEAKLKISQLQEDLIYTKSELSLHNNKPADTETKGNSLFAEVNDKRLRLQNELKLFKKQNITLQSQLGKLHTSCTKMNMQWKEDMETIKFDIQNLEQTYKGHIGTLEMLVSKYENECDMRFKIDGTDDFRGFKALLNIKISEIEKLQQEMNKNSVTHFQIAQNCAQAKCQLREWRLRAMENETEINALKKIIEDLKLELNTKESTEADTSEDVESNKIQEASIVSAFKKQPMVETENKENVFSKFSEKAHKSVSFNVDAADSSNVNFRRRAKTSQCPTTYL